MIVTVSNEADTLPTLQTVLDRIMAFQQEMYEFRAFVERRFDAVERRLSVIERQLENMDIRLDGIESFAHQTRSEVLALRKDFKEFKLQNAEPATERTT